MSESEQQLKIEERPTGRRHKTESISRAPSRTENELHQPNTLCYNLPCPKNPMLCLKTVLFTTGALQVGLGLTSVIVVRYNDELIDNWYKQRGPRVMLYIGSIIIIINGILLLLSLLWKKRAIMWVYIVMSTSMCIYILILAVVMINSAMNAAVVDVRRLAAEPAGGAYAMSDIGVVIGFMTLFAAVLLFVANIAVCAYYNVFFVEPLLLRRNP